MHAKQQLPGLLKMEKEIFKELGFKVYGYPTAFEFAQRLMIINDMTEKEFFTAIYFSLLCIFSDDFIKTKPSVIAFIAVKQALQFKLKSLKKEIDFTD